MKRKCIADPRACFEVHGSVLVALGARLRGSSKDVPFAPDARTLKRTTILALETPMGSIDLLVDPDGAPRCDGIAIRVVSLDDLLSMKRAAGRPQDVADIDALLTVQRVQRRDAAD